jgi:hypothetical protein
MSSAFPVVLVSLQGPKVKRPRWLLPHHDENNQRLLFHKEHNKGAIRCFPLHAQSSA